MEGPALAFKALLLCWLLMAVYKRFERVHDRFPAFEAFVGGRPLIVVLSVESARLVEVRDRLARELADGAVVGLGARPWSFHLVRFAVGIEDQRVCVRAVSARLLRVVERPPAELFATIAAVCGSVEAVVEPTAFVDLDDGTRPPESGWRLWITPGNVRPVLRSSRNTPSIPPPARPAARRTNPEIRAPH
ncbi:MAG: hypothetical protein ACXWUG_27590 [Polyangiales bacterium]